MPFCPQNLQGLSGNLKLIWNLKKFSSNISFISSKLLHIKYLLMYNCSVDLLMKFEKSSNFSCFFNFILFTLFFKVFKPGIKVHIFIWVKSYHISIGLKLCLCRQFFFFFFFCHNFQIKSYVTYFCINFCLYPDFLISQFNIYVSWIALVFWFGILLNILFNTHI